MADKQRKNKYDEEVGLNRKKVSYSKLESETPKFDEDDFKVLQRVLAAKPSVAPNISKVQEYNYYE
jgi:hypothetical protein